MTFSLKNGYMPIELCCVQKYRRTVIHLCRWSCFKYRIYLFFPPCITQAVEIGIGFLGQLEFSAIFVALFMDLCQYRIVCYQGTCCYLESNWDANDDYPCFYLFLHVWIYVLIQYYFILNILTYFLMDLVKHQDAW